MSWIGAFVCLMGFCLFWMVQCSKKICWCVGWTEDVHPRNTNTNNSKSATAAFTTSILHPKLLAMSWRCVGPTRGIQNQYTSERNSLINLDFFQVPAYHKLYRVEHGTTTYLRLARSTDGCNPIMAHGSANVFQAEDGGIRLQNPSCPAISCRVDSRVTDAWSPHAVSGVGAARLGINPVQNPKLITDAWNPTCMSGAKQPNSGC